MRYVEVAGRLTLALVFLAAVVGKVRGRAAFAEFARSVDQFGLLPRAWATAAAYLAVAAEAAVVGLLAVPATVRAGYAVATGLLGVLSAAIVAAVRRGRRPACRCFGAGGAPLGARHVLRNAVLLAVAGFGWAVLALAPPEPLRPAGLLLGLAAAVPVAALVIRFDDLAALFAPTPSRRSPAAPVAGRRRG
ncbi:Methylamine utilisation protein MauE [Micromonospora echinaurantiaca]|uniref:Methylamine utilisation protein MauE n=1 Tax=Micromonospora echinaurantiaca TaxID=47857 RepID=A0A1C5IMT3_9ACTN|nr:MauE/DoxX family redox-associated membrane protein [Micromonospora echinaurantiaca]SCG59630.1 Methylamine utilisation protein MauE [Micromonospora echinaurantiaca]